MVATCDTPPAPAAEAAFQPRWQDPRFHLREAARHRDAGDLLAALAHDIAATALRDFRRGLPGALAALPTVAHGYFMKGDHAQAQCWYELLLELEPCIAPAWQNLAAIHALAGRSDQAQACRARAYALQRVFVETPPGAQRRLLILSSGQGSGNIPLDALLAAGRSSRIKYVIDYASVDEDARLPDYDLVLNAVGEPDVAAALAPRLEGFAQACRRPVLNAPARVAQTQRHGLAGLLQGLDDVTTSACVRHETLPASAAELATRLGAGGLDWPVLSRPVATHGGQGLARSDDPAALHRALAELAGPYYLTQYVDTRGADGWFRKYRVIFIDRQPHAYHLAISRQWMVHYFSADMQAHPWKLEEERRFLAAPAVALGERAMAAVRAIGRRLDLDYAGIDFTVLPDGRVFVFEANATMLVHWERANGPLAYRNAPVQAIVDAFEGLQLRRLATSA